MYSYGEIVALTAPMVDEEPENICNVIILAITHPDHALKIASLTPINSVMNILRAAIILGELGVWGLEPTTENGHFRGSTPNAETAITALDQDVMPELGKLVQYLEKLVNFPGSESPRPPDISQNDGTSNGG